MNEEAKDHNKNVSNSLVLALGVAITIAACMVIATTVSFFKSSAYTTVKQIQTGNQFVRSIDKDSIDTVSPINASDIDEYSKGINDRLKTLDDSDDFGPNDVSDTALGLN